jgi:hypothetical protein
MVFRKVCSGCMFLLRRETRCSDFMFFLRRGSCKTRALQRWMHGWVRCHAIHLNGMHVWRTRRDGNGEFPVGDQPPIPVPAGIKFPRPRPRQHSRGTIFSHPRSPSGISSPSGSPSPPTKHAQNCTHDTSQNAQRHSHSRRGG